MIQPVPDAEATNPCFMCEMERYDPEKLNDPEFIKDRKSEFFPEEEYGDYVHICTPHMIKVSGFYNSATRSEVVEFLSFFDEE